MNAKTEAFRQDFRKNVIPSTYKGSRHVLFNFGLLALVMGLSLSQVQSPSSLQWLTFPGVMLLGNLVVFFVHKFPLHKPGVNSYAFKMHTRYHHHFFTHDHITYSSAQDFWILFFPPEVVGSFSLVVCPITYALLLATLGANIAGLFTFSCAVYFMLYEIFHYVSHLPKDHLVLKLFPPFAYMREHHRIHHDHRLMGRYNFNIVYPLFDILMGTKYKGPVDPEKI